jgi:hypothetical protein
MSFAYIHAIIRPTPSRVISPYLGFEGKTIDVIENLNHADT